MWIDETNCNWKIIKNKGKKGIRRKIKEARGRNCRIIKKDSIRIRKVETWSRINSIKNETYGRII